MNAGWARSEMVLSLFFFFFFETLTSRSLSLLSPGKKNNARSSPSCGEVRGKRIDPKIRNGLEWSSSSITGVIRWYYAAHFRLGSVVFVIIVTTHLCIFMVHPGCFVK